MGKRKCPSGEGLANIYTVENICKKKIRNNKEPLYYIKWKDWDEKYNTWEPSSNILDKSLIQTFEDEQREKQKLKISKLKSNENREKVHCESNNETISINHDTRDDEKQEFIEENNNYQQCEEEKSEDPTYRPKICLKISKKRIQSVSPLFDNKPIASKSDDDVDEQHFDTDEDDLKPFCNVSTFLDKSTDRSSVDETNNAKSSKPVSPNFHSDISQLTSPRSKAKLFSDVVSKKPRKLLSINDYSGIIKMKKKKEHRKSKHRHQRIKSKIKSYRTDHRYFPEKFSISNKTVDGRLKELNHIYEDNGRLQPINDNIDNISERSYKSNSVETIEQKNDLNNSMMKSIKYHTNTTVTDVRVDNLTVTIREMPLEDFQDYEGVRFHLVRVPKKSDWKERMFKLSRESGGSGEKRSSEEQIVPAVADTSESEIHKQLLLDKFAKRIIPGLRPPSRPRSVDSYKTSMTKGLSDETKLHFSMNISPKKGGIVLQRSITVNDNASSRILSPSIVTEDEEVDVVGGIDSDRSLMTSPQMVDPPIHPCPVTSVVSIIQSLLQSYSSMTTPGLITSQPFNSMFSSGPSVTHHQLYLNRPNSIDPYIMKHTSTTTAVSPPYFIQTGVFMNGSQENPIDLSLK